MGRSDRTLRFGAIRRFRSFWKFWCVRFQGRCIPVYVDRPRAFRPIGDFPPVDPSSPPPLGTHCSHSRTYFYYFYTALALKADVYSSVFRPFLIRQFLPSSCVKHINLVRLDECRMNG